MGRAIAEARAPGMTAEGDLLPVLVPAIGITTVAGCEIEQRDQPRPDPDAAQLHWLGLLHGGFRRLAPAERVRPVLREGARSVRQSRYERRTWHPLGRGEPHPLGPPDHRASGVARSKSCVNFPPDLREGHSLEKIVAQRVGVRRRPIARFHSVCLVIHTLAPRQPGARNRRSDIPNKKSS